MTGVEDAEESSRDEQVLLFWCPRSTSLFDVCRADCFGIGEAGPFHVISFRMQSLVEILFILVLRVFAQSLWSTL